MAAAAIVRSSLLAGVAPFSLAVVVRAILPLPRLLNFNSFRLEEVRLREELDSCEKTRESLREALSTSMQVKSPGSAEERPPFERGLSDDSFRPQSFDMREKSASSPHGFQSEVMCRSVIREKTEDMFSTQVQTVFPSHQGCITRARFSVTGNRVACSSTDGVVSVWDTDSPRNARYVVSSAPISSLDWDMKTETMLAIGTTSGHVRLWDSSQLKIAHEFCASQRFPRISDLCFSPTSRHLVTSCSDAFSGTTQAGELLAWNMKRLSEGPEMSFTLSAESINVKSIKFNHNGNMLIAGCSDGMIRVFDMNHRDAIMGWKAHDGPVSCVRYASHETSLFSVGVDGKLMEWSVHNCGRAVKEFHFPSFQADPGSPMNVMTPNKGKNVLHTHLVRANTPLSSSKGGGEALLPAPEVLSREHTHISPPVKQGSHSRGQSREWEEEEEEEEEGGGEVLPDEFSP